MRSSRVSGRIILSFGRRFDECDAYTAAYGDRVLAVEYRARDFRKTCAGFGDRLAVVLRDRDLTPDGVRRWC